MNEETDDDSGNVHCPLYLLMATAKCWRCQKPQLVTALAAHHVTFEDDTPEQEDDDEPLDGPWMLTYITELPAEVLQHVIQRNPRYKWMVSNTAQGEYFANTCECGALFGDFHLYGDDGAFFPHTPEQVRAIQVTKLPFAGKLRFDCDVSPGMGDLGHCRFEDATWIDTTP